MSFIVQNGDDSRVQYSSQLEVNNFIISDLKGEWLHRSFPMGDLKMKQWLFDGIRFGYSECLFKNPVSFDWRGDMDVVTLYFNLKGRVSMGNKQNRIELGTNQQNMFYDTEATGTMKADELRLKSFMVQFTKDAFIRIASGGNDTLRHFADQVAAGKPATLSGSNLYIDASIQNCINAVLTCSFSDSLKRLFFMSKAMELLVLQAEAHNRMLLPQSVYAKTEYDRERIIFARDYMLSHLEMPPSITELAQLAGLNEFKLKKGYKELFGTTIFGHLAEARLELAQQELQQKEKSITQIAIELGYCSVQHFSRAFKTKYGIAPKQAQINY
jgi:AraC family transcriptional activator of pyochelin receptor